jgi:hypothetical protein
MRGTRGRNNLSTRFFRQYMELVAVAGVGCLPQSILSLQLLFAIL